MIAGAGCDAGHQDDQPYLGAPIHLVASNVGPSQPLSTTGSVELAFDRLLLPVSVTRQTFPIRDEKGNYLTPAITYDPVARVVTLSAPGPDRSGWVRSGQTYTVDVLSPKNASDINGLRAIDLGTLAASSSSQIHFTALANAPSTPVPPVADFCRDVYPLFTSKCTSATCHGGDRPAAGLRLDSPTTIAVTAIGRVAQGANSGPRAASEAPGLHFGVDMPLVDPGPGSPSAGDPAHSWLLYKLLMAPPPACSSTPGAPPCDGGTSVPPQSAHAVSWRPISDHERAALANLVAGREMPYPTLPGGALADNPAALTLEELESVSSWIAQGAPVPAACP